MSPAAAVTAALDDLEHLIAATPPALLARAADGRRPRRAPSGEMVPRCRSSGHLVDSALNNIQRAVRLQSQAVLDLPGYDPDLWVDHSHHAERPWPDLVETWTALNRHLLHIARRLPPAALAHAWRHAGQRLTTAFIVEDYLRHLREHLEHLLPGGCAAVDGSAPPRSTRGSQEARS